MHVTVSATSFSLCASVFLTHKMEVIPPRAIGRINIFIEDG